jgi:pimeloyl-ACP methyl ester carboxylesterase
MRRLLVAPLLAAVLGLTLDAPPAGAQAPAKPVEEAFTTADGVRLKGLFHKSPRGDKQGDAVVVLLYPPGADRDMLKGDWDGLVGRLNAEGFHVFRFDWRGHGGSFDITDPLGDNTPFNGFWVNTITGRWNQRFVTGFNRKPVKNDIRVKADIKGPGYFPVYVNDLAAARLHLDRMNDRGRVNTSTIYLVGAGDTAALGMLWLAAEWARPAALALDAPPVRVVPSPAPGAAFVPAGADVAGAVWLSAARPAVVPEVAVKELVKAAPRLRDENPMLFVYGADDNTAKRESEFFFNKALVAGGDPALGIPPVNRTFLFPVAKTKLNGINLLGQRLDPQPETKIVQYLTAAQKLRGGGGPLRQNRNYALPYHIDVTKYGIGPP